MSIIKINDININYRIEGKGKTIVFVHGLSDNLNYWSILTSELKNKYQTLTFDLRGHGESDLGDEDININSYQDDLYQLLKALNIENAVFVGLSLGGNIILDFALNHPEMVDGLIVMSSFSEQTEKLTKIFNDFDESINKGFGEFFDTILPYTLTEDLLEEYKDLFDELKIQGIENANIEGIKKGILAGHKFNVTDRLSEIEAPTLVIAGAEDDLTDLDIQKKISDNIKNSELIVFENTKHNILIGKNIQKLLDIIDDFMSKIY